MTQSILRGLSATAAALLLLIPAVPASAQSAPVLHLAAAEHGDTDHKGADHEDMNHSPMDHKEMAHEEMEHAGHDAALPAPVTLGALTLSDAFTRATLPNAPVGGGYVTITNAGDTPDRLIGASSPMAKEVQIHEMSIQDDVMRMRQLPDGIAIAPGTSLTLAPGGLHLMFMGLTEAFIAGQSVPVTLRFEHAGTIAITLGVADPGAKQPADPHAGH